MREGAPEREVLNFCANNYLGLSSHPASSRRRTARDRRARLRPVVACASSAARRTSTRSSRRKISTFFGTEDTILYSSCFDANGGLFETLLGEEDAIISDALNHASIIDGIRLCKAERHRYPNGDMAELEDALKETQGKRLRMIATDGVFSMDGYLAQARRDLRSRRQVRRDGDGRRLARDRLRRQDRAAARPSTAACMSRVDVITSTLGKALGGARGGFTTGKKEIVELLRQRSRPYLFSNTLAPAIVGRVDRGPRAARRARPSCAIALDGEREALPRRA